jgi:hypothetical protein
MKEMNSLEAQLRSWTPRPPRPALERRLFGSPQPPTWHWPRLAQVFAPAAVCLLLTWVSLDRAQPLVTPEQHSQAALLACSLSNQSFTPYLPGNGQSAANRLDTFEWTNRGDSRSSVPSFPPPKAVEEN